MEAIPDPTSHTVFAGQSLVGGIMASDTASSGQPEPSRVIDYSPHLTMTEATGRAILAQLMVLQEQMADVAGKVSALVESGQARGVVATPRSMVGDRR